MKLMLLFLTILISTQTGLSQPQSFELSPAVEFTHTAVSSNHPIHLSGKPSFNHTSSSANASSFMNLWVEEVSIESVDAELAYAHLVEFISFKVPTYYFTPQPSDTPLVLSLLEYVSLFSNSPPTLA